MPSLKTKVIPFAAVLAVSLAPAIHARERDSGVGILIAAQGDRALEFIRADARETTLKLTRPLLLPARPKATARAAGAATTAAATMRSAE